MAQYGKKRGVNYDKEKRMSVDEKRRQWNINLANRTLQNLFGQVSVGDDVIINNRRSYTHRNNYTPNDLYELARAYFENIAEVNETEEIAIVPDIEDFCAFCKMPRSRFLAYRRSDDMEMAEVANTIANAIASCKKQNAFQGLINPMAFMADMNNNHDYVQAKTETTINSNISIQQVETSIADIASRIPMEDVMMLEEKKENDKEGDNG